MTSPSPARMRLEDILKMLKEIEETEVDDSPRLVKLRLDDIEGKLDAVQKCCADIKRTLDGLLKERKDQRIDWAKRVVFLDTETTGLSTKRDHIIQFAAVASDPAVLHFSTLVGTEKKSSRGALATHKIRDEDRKDAGNWKVVFSRWKQWLQTHFDGRDFVLVAHNGRRFDFPIMWHEMRRHGLDPYAEFGGKNIKILDTMLHAGAIKAPKPRTQKVLYAKFVGGEFRNAHDALGDTVALRTLALSPAFKIDWDRDPIPFDNWYEKWLSRQR